MYVCARMKSLMFVSSAGADNSARSVSSCEGGGDGREVSAAVVGGLADSGPSTAQPG